MGPQYVQNQQVTVMCYPDDTAEVVVVRDHGDVLEVSTAEEIQAAAKENRKPLTVGFKRDDVVPEPAKKKVAQAEGAAAPYSSKAGD